jgi:small subunit ribosomal protein S15
MSLPTETICEIVANHQQHDKDTGSPEVQVALLTKKIESLTTHLKSHKHDKDSRRGMEIMVSARKKMLRHLKRKNLARFEKIVKELGIRAKNI